MKFRKLLLCMFAGLFLTGFANIYTYAAEEGNVVTEETTINNDTNQVTDITTTAATPTEAAMDVTNEDADKADETAQEATDDTTEEIKNDVKVTTKVTTDTKKDKTTVKETTKESTKKTVAKKTKVVKETVNYTKAELRLLSAIIYCEANAESYNGKLAVGIVVMNRVRSNVFPDSVKDVIYQKYQFGPVSNGALVKQLAAYDAGKYTDSYELECIKAAKEALNGAKSITVNGKAKDFSKFLFFSGRLKNATFNLGHHQFK